MGWDDWKECYGWKGILRGNIEVKGALSEEGKKRKL